MECYGYLRNVHDNMADGETAYENRCSVTFDRPLIPICTTRRVSLNQFGKKMLPGIFTRHDLRAGGGWSGDLLTADWEDLDNLSASTMSTLSFPCADGSLKVFKLPRPHRGEWAAEGNLMQEVEETSFEDEDGTHFGSMSGDVTYRHHEVHRSTLYVPKRATLSFLMST